MTRMISQRIPQTEPAAADTSAKEERLPALTKIIATIGPASEDSAVIGKLIEAGVSVFRFNFSHGSPDEHFERLQRVRAVTEELMRPIAVMGDLPGPKIRVANAPADGVHIDSGELLVIARESIVAQRCEGGLRLSSRYDKLIDDVQVGHRLLINDGAVRTLVVEKHTDQLVCSVIHGGLITAGKGINLPDSTLSVPSMTDADWQWVQWAIENEMDLLALSFVRSADDVRALKQGINRITAQLGRSNFVMPVVAKIETPQAIDNIDEILGECDGIMVARGDLGVEVDIARVPVLQKQLIATARSHARPCIVATQMLESMINSAVPTRAEATDVAGAIFDGADAVMLSGETAVGKYPVLTVEHMRLISMYTEGHLASEGVGGQTPWRPIESGNRTACLAHGVWTVANDLNAKFIVVWSQQGGGARHLSQYDFHVPILAVSTDDRALRQMQLLRGVTPVRMPLPENLAHFTAMLDLYLLDTGWARQGDPCVLVAGGPIGRTGATNSLAIHCIGDPEGGFSAHHA